jgi:hypothetical protein
MYFPSPGEVRALGPVFTARYRLLVQAWRTLTGPNQEIPAEILPFFCI